MSEAAHRAMHLFLRFKEADFTESNLSLNTIEEHRKLLRDRGVVWWGSPGQHVAARTIATLKKQIAEQLETRVYMYEQETQNWYQGRLVDVASVRPADTEHVPEYYRQTTCASYFKLSAINGPILRGQARHIHKPLVYVYERDGEGPVHIRVISSDRPLLLDRGGGSGEGAPDDWITLEDEVDEPEKYREGTTKRIPVDVFERSQKARTKCLEHHGKSCVVCGFEFGQVYGELGCGYIQVHHLRPLSTVEEGYEVDPVEDLRPVCPNCHAMLHRRRPPLEIQELADILQLG